MSANIPFRTTWFKKLFECIYVYIAVAEVFYMSVTTLFYKYFSKTDEITYIKIFLYAGGVFLLIAIAYSLYWHRKQSNADFNSMIKHAWLRGILRYFIAYEISVYGFAKILKTQFGHLYYRDDLPVGSLNGFELTWNYFGHSYTFAVILGLLQICGGVLLLFRRTSLLGIFILLPVMVNIVLINLFYDIATGAFINSIILTTGLLYLLLLRWTDLKTIFFTYNTDLPPVKLGFIKHIARVLAIVIAFSGLYYYEANMPPTTFEGKWDVTEYKRNGKVIDKNDWLNNPKSWCKIYMEEGGRLALSPNPYAFDAARAWFGKYQYNAQKKTLKVVFEGSQTDAAQIKVSDYNGNIMQWNTIINSDTVQMKLIKE